MLTLTRGQGGSEKIKICFPMYLLPLQEEKENFCSERFGGIVEKQFLLAWRLPLWGCQGQCPGSYGPNKCQSQFSAEAAWTRAALSHPPSGAPFFAPLCQSCHFPHAGPSLLIGEILPLHRSWMFCCLPGSWTCWMLISWKSHKKAATTSN